MKRTLRTNGRSGALRLSLILLSAALLPQMIPTWKPDPRSPRKTTSGALTYTTSWIGNTFGGDGKSVQSSVLAIYVTPDGTVYTNSGWDEAGREAGVYRDGDALPNPEHTHGWGQSGGSTVTANSRFLYLGARMDSQNGSLIDANTWPPAGTYWYGISRRRLSDPRLGAPFAGGKGGGGDTLPSSFLIINSVPEDTDASVSGLAADENRLYVSNPDGDEVRIYDAYSLALLSAFPLTRPGPLVLDRNGTLWIIQTGDQTHSPRVLHFSSDGTPLPDAIDDVIDPRGLAIDRAGRLMIAEAGPRQQILMYDVSSPPGLAQAFGRLGGIYAETPGIVADVKFAFPVGVGSDAAGNIYIASSTPGTDIRKFSPSGELLWRLLGLVFQETAVADLENGPNDVFTRTGRFSMDFRKPPGRQWTWTGLTINPFQYPDDPRLSVKFLTAYAVRYLQGKPFLFLVADNSAFLIFRFDGGIAVPSVVFAPRPIDRWLPLRQPQSRYIWRDSNGDGTVQSDEFYDADGELEFDSWGWDVDSNGDVWEAREQDGLRQFPLQRLDGVGNPVYNRSSSVDFGKPDPFTSIERIKYIAQTDSMYISGFTREHPELPNAQWGLVGSEVARFDRWKLGNRGASWRITLPYTPPVDGVKAFTIAGDRLFAAILDSRGAAQSPAPQNLYVYDARNGTLLGRMTPGPEVGSRMGWVDIGQGVHAAQLTNGEYSVFVEEVLWGKVLLYRVN